MTARLPPPKPVNASPLVDSIRHCDPSQFDDGQSDLSLAITLQTTPGDRLAALEQEFRRRYLEPHLPPPTVSALSQATRLAQKLTRQRLQERTSGLRLGNGHEDRCLLLSVPRSHWKDLPDRHQVRTRAGVVMYGLSRAAELQTWSEEHEVPVSFTSLELSEVLQRIGGTLHLTVSAGLIHLFSLKGGYDPDRQIALRQIRPGPPPWQQVNAGELSRLAGVAFEHRLHFTFQVEDAVRTLTAPHQSVSELRRRLRHLGCLDMNTGHPKVTDTPE